MRAQDAPKSADAGSSSSRRVAQGRDHDRQMLVEVDAKLLGADPHVVPVDRGGEARLLHLLLDGLRRHPDQALGPHVGARKHEPAQLVDREQRLLHRRLARDPHEVGMRSDRADQLRRVTARLELADRVTRVSIAEIRIALVVEVVEQAGQPPELDVAVEPRGVGAHRGLDGQHVPAQRIRLSPFAKEVPGLRRAKQQLAWPLP